MNLFPVTFIDKIFDSLSDPETSRALLQFLFFIDIILTTFLTITDPRPDRLLAMFGMYMMILIPLVVLHRQRHPKTEDAPL